MPSPCTASSHVISVKAFRWRTRSDHVTRNALAARNNKAYGQGKTADSGSVQSLLPLKTMDTGILLLAVFTLELETDYPSETSPVYSRPLPDRHPLSDFFSEGRGRLCTGYLERIIPSANCPSKLKDKVRRIVHAKLKLFHYLSEANHQTDNPSHTNNPSLVWKRPFLSLMNVVPRPWVRRSRVCFAFSQRLFLNWLLTFLCVK